ncbi:MAG: MarR family transcriptional regulator [Clostridia bacterium]|nr:MarR family transcriptional regulator [Clostridia bacterium]
MSEKEFDSLKLDNQICFPLYAASREIIRQYRPFLEKLDLTYTQYITMMVFWEVGQINVKELGRRLYLDSGTLTPLLKSLEAKGFVHRSRSKTDERVLNVELTGKGAALRDRALEIPSEIRQVINLDDEEEAVLYRLLYKVIGGSEENI